MAFAVFASVAGIVVLVSCAAEPDRQLRGSSGTGTGATGVDNFCQGKPAGLYRAPPGLSGNIDCRGFFHCQHGNEPLQLCSDTTRFDPALLVCNWKSEVQCSEDSAISTTVAPSSTVLVSTTTVGTTALLTSTAEVTITESLSSSVPCVHSKTFTFPGWPIQQDSSAVTQMVDRCTNENVPFVNTDDSATCLLNSHADGYDYDKWTPESACPFPLGEKPGVSQAQCKENFANWKALGVRMVSLPGGIEAMTAIGHGVLNGVRGECALLEHNGRFAVVFQVDVRSWSLEITESTLNFLTENQAPGGHCWVPTVKPISCPDQ